MCAQLNTRPSDAEVDRGAEGTTDEARGSLAAIEAVARDAQLGELELHRQDGGRGCAPNAVGMVLGAAGVLLLGLSAAGLADEIVPVLGVLGMVTALFIVYVARRGSSMKQFLALFAVAVAVGGPSAYAASLDGDSTASLVVAVGMAAALIGGGVYLGRRAQARSAPAAGSLTLFAHGLVCVTPQLDGGRPAAFRWDDTTLEEAVTPVGRTLHHTVTCTRRDGVWVRPSFVPTGRLDARMLRRIQEQMAARQVGPLVERMRAGQTVTLGGSLVGTAAGLGAPGADGSGDLAATIAWNDVTGFSFGDGSFVVTGRRGRRLDVPAEDVRDVGVLQGVVDAMRAGPAGEAGAASAAAAPAAPLPDTAPAAPAATPPPPDASPDAPQPPEPAQAATTAEPPEAPPPPPGAWGPPAPVPAPPGPYGPPPAEPAAPTRPGRNHRTVIVVVALVLVLGLLAVLLLRDDGGATRETTTPPTDGPGTTAPDPQAAARDRQRIDLVVASRPVVEALEAEASAAYLHIVQPAGVPAGATDVPGTRAATDEAVAAFEEAVAGAGEVGDAYETARSSLDGLEAVRSRVDDVASGRGADVQTEAVVVDDGYRATLVDLVDDVSTIAEQVESADLRVGAGLYATALRQQQLAQQLLTRLSQAARSGGRLGDTDLGSTVSQLWNDYDRGLASIRNDAEGTDYERAVDRLEEDLARTGYLAVVPEILDGAPIDVEMLVETSSSDASSGWPMFLTTVETVLAAQGPAAD